MKVLQVCSVQCMGDACMHMDGWMDESFSALSSTTPDPTNLRENGPLINEYWIDEMIIINEWMLNA